MADRLLARRRGELALRPCDLSELDQCRDEGAFVWLDVTSRDADRLDELGRRFDFAPAAIEDVLDIEQLPKFDDYGDHLFVVLHALVSRGDRLDTHEVDCFVGDQMLVTVRAESVAGLEWLWGAVQEHPHMAEHGAGELFAQLAEVVGRRYLELVDALEDRIDGLADAALEADPSVLAEIQLLRREESTVRQVLRPQRMVVGSLRTAGRAVLGEGAVTVLGDAYDVHNLVVESMISTRSLLTDTLDTYRGASAERQSNAANLLTVYAAIMLPLTVITGWYGMNVSGLPAADRPWGWWAVTGAMGVFVVASWLLFARAGMIRRPRIVGGGRIVRGLADAAKAPVRPFTMLRRSDGPSSGD